jgi:hypothetical protein
MSALIPALIELFLSHRRGGGGGGGGGAAGGREPRPQPSQYEQSQNYWRSQILRSAGGNDIEKSNAAHLDALGRAAPSMSYNDVLGGMKNNPFSRR